MKAINAEIKALKEKTQIDVNLASRLEALKDEQRSSAMHQAAVKTALKETATKITAVKTPGAPPSKKTTIVPPVTKVAGLPPVVVAKAKVRGPVPVGKVPAVYVDYEAPAICGRTFGLPKSISKSQFPIFFIFETPSVHFSMC